MRYTRLPRILILLPTLLCSVGFGSGCLSVGPDHIDNRNVSAKSATKVKATVVVRAGELNVGGGADDLVEGEFTYNVAAFRPDVTYTVENDEGELLVEQPPTRSAFFLSGQTKNLWDLKLSETIRMDIQFQLGATKSRIDLSELTLGTVSIDGGAGDLNIKLVGKPDLDELTMELGAGKTTVDLAGLWSKDVNVDIEAGVGDISVRLPADIGVKLSLDSGVGSEDIQGLHKDGEFYFNEEWDENPVSMEIKVESGVGRISVVTD